MNELLTLARGRYPDDAPAMALAMFLSDRRRAGLGALKPRQPVLGSRRWQTIEWYKYQDDWRPERPIFYRACFDLPARQEREPAPRYESLEFGVYDGKTTVRKLPAIERQFEVRFHPRDFVTQADRNRTAAALWHARRTMRRAIAALQGTRAQPAPVPS